MNHVSKASLYPAAQMISARLERYFAQYAGESPDQKNHELASVPDRETIETIVDTAFWASLQREEGYAPKISLGYLSPEQAGGQPMMFAEPLPLNPHALTKLSPAVERPSIYLGVWRNAQNQLSVWGATRTVPQNCFVLEVIEPGLLVVKHRRGSQQSKFANVLIFSGEQIKEIDEQGTSLSDCPEMLAAMLRFGSSSHSDQHVSILVQLAVSMRKHKRGGSLLIVPQNTEIWKESIVLPARYLVTPSFTGLADLFRQPPQSEINHRLHQELLFDAVETIAGLTAVDGATLISEEYELMAFGAKIKRRDDRTRVEHAILTEPIIGNEPSVVHPLQFGGTRHLSAAQFVQDQPDSIALVSSQDGRFTVLAWSPCERMVHAHRIESLLL
ncbi:MAG: putative sensor domain DACNV-containing protein [Pyrinomonadaceae bacterium]